MAYTSINFKSKKALKEAVASGARITTWSPGPFPVKTDGRDVVEGPQYPQPHKWYASVVVENGYITKVS